MQVLGHAGIVLAHRRKRPEAPSARIIRVPHMLLMPVANARIWQEIPDSLVDPDSVISESLYKKLRDRDESLRYSPVEIEFAEAAIAGGGFVNNFEFFIWAPSWAKSFIAEIELKAGAADEDGMVLRAKVDGGTLGSEAITTSDTYSFLTSRIILASSEIETHIKIIIESKEVNSFDANGNIRSQAGNSRSRLSFEVG
ncbi:hypothetical protein LCGC14_0427520 [marine sediment metagenome]|uniref:Uncharacterized protein n=1 Tax=marine sediment metagenome TaxID=412755 RepID=A0A0F9T728_9ZZZZ